MPVVRFISLLANGQSDTQWFPRHLHHDHHHHDCDTDDDEYIGVAGVDDKYVCDDDDGDDDHTCCTSNVEEAWPLQQMLSAPEI